MRTLQRGPLLNALHLLVSAGHAPSAAATRDIIELLVTSTRGGAKRTHVRLYPAALLAFQAPTPPRRTRPPASHEADVHARGEGDGSNR